MNIPPSLIARRTAAHCLNKLCTELQLGAKAEKFISDVDEDWDVRGDWEILALKNGRIVAEVYLMEGKANIVIPNWHGLIRTDHLGDFEPHEHAMRINNARNPITDEKHPDGFVENYAYGEIPGLNHPKMIIQRRTRIRAPRVIV